MPIVKKFLAILLISSFLVFGMLLSYKITYHLLKSNFASLSLSGSDTKVVEVTVKNIYVISDILREYFNTLNSRDKVLDSKRLSEYRVILFQIRTEYKKLIDSYKDKLSQPLEKIVKDFDLFLERVDIMMKFPSDSALADSVCTDLKNLLKTMSIFSKTYRLRYQLYFEKLLKEFQEKCKF